MVDKLHNFRLMLLIIIIPILFSCATNQQKQEKSRDADFYNNRGVAYAEKGQLDQAIADYNKALEINPRHASAYNNRGNAYYKKSQYDQAIADYNKAIEINPRYALAYNNRGVIYYFKREYENSWKDVEKAQSLGYQIHPEFLEELRKASGREK